GCCRVESLAGGAVGPEWRCRCPEGRGGLQLVDDRAPRARCRVVGLVYDGDLEVGSELRQMLWTPRGLDAGDHHGRVVLALIGLQDDDADVRSPPSERIPGLVFQLVTVKEAQRSSADAIEPAHLPHA